MSRSERHKRALEGVYTLQKLKTQHKWTPEDRFMILNEMDIVIQLIPKSHIPVPPFHSPRINDDLLPYSFRRFRSMQQMDSLS
jgi:hypothetical protein